MHRPRMAGVPQEGLAAALGGLQRRGGGGALLRLDRQHLPAFKRVAGHAALHAAAQGEGYF